MEDKPILIEIVAYAPTAFYHCTHCEVVWQETGFSKGLHEEQVASALPPDLASAVLIPRISTFVPISSPPHPSTTMTRSGTRSCVASSSSG